MAIASHDNNKEIPGVNLQHPFTVMIELAGCALHRIAVHYEGQAKWVAGRSQGRIFASWIMLGSRPCPLRMRSCRAQFRVEV